ncbi:hypothetical protein D3C73_1470890 [compost metagenome]
MENGRQPSRREQLLRLYECYCYQVAFSLLGNEKDSLEAARLTLLSLAADDGFASLPGAMQREQVKRAASIHSIHIRKNAVQAGR